MQVFFGQTYRTLKALGRLGVSILSMFGEMSGGGSPTKSIKVADAMVSFLDTLGRGLERFGSYSADSLTTVGPALTRFFKALGGLAATANLNGTITNVIDMITKLIDLMNGFTKATGTGDLLNFMLKMRIYTYTLGIVMGNILGPFSRFVGMAQGFLNVLGGAGKAGGLFGEGGKIAGMMGGKLGKAGRALSIATAQPVFVTNWPVGMGMGGSPMGGPGGGGGGGGRGGKGGPRAPGRWGRMAGRTGRFGRVLGLGTMMAGAGSMAYNTRAAASMTPGISRVPGVKATGFSRLGQVEAGMAVKQAGMRGALKGGALKAIPVAGYGLVAYDAVKIARSDASGMEKTAAFGNLGAITAGATVGATMGSALGPLGTIGGGAVGAVGGATVAPLANMAADKIYGTSKMDKAGNFYEQQANAYRGISTGKGNIYKTEKQNVQQLLQTLDLKTQAGQIGAKMVTESLNMNDADAAQLIAAERSRQITGDIMKATLAMEKNRKMTDKAKDAMRKKLGLTKPEMQKAENKVAFRKGHRAQAKADNKYGIQRIGGTAYISQAQADKRKADQLAALQKSGKSSSQSNYLLMKHEQIARMQGVKSPVVATKGEIQTAKATEQAKGLAGVQQAASLGEQYQPMIDKLNTLRDQIRAVDPNNPDNEFFQNMDGATTKIGELMPQINSELETQYGTLTTTINEQNGLLASQIDTTGTAIVANTNTWVSGVNTALGGLVNPVAAGGDIPTNALGGFVPKFAKGGVIMGDPRKGDVVPLMAAGGEVILNEQQQQAVGKGRINTALRGGTTPHHKSFDGSGRAKKYAEGGEVTANPFQKIESMFGLHRSSGDHDGAGVHASGSYHYRAAPWGGVQAYDYGDASNSPAALQAAAAYANQNASMFAEEFFDKYPSYVKNGNVVKGAFGGHTNRSHSWCRAQWTHGQPAGTW
jgi:hypothetical protein